jgi:hypothetical protein
MGSSLLNKTQKKYLKELTALGRDELGKPAPPLETLLPEIDPLQEAAISLGMQYGQGEMGQARQGAIMSQLGGESGYEGVSPEFMREQLQALYMDPAMRAFNQDIAPQIESQYSGTEAWRGGDISRAISEAAEGVGVGAVQSLAGLTENELQRKFEAQQSAYGRQTSAIDQSSEEEKAPVRFRLMAGDIRRGIASEKAQYDIYKEQQQNPWANPALGMAPLILGQYKAPSSSGGGSSGIGSMVSGLLGPVGGLIGGLF